VKRTAIASILILAFEALACTALLGAGEIDVAIRYFDKRVYYAGAETGPVLVQVTIANRGASTFRFKLADERAFSVDFELRTLANRVLEPAQILTRKRTQDQHVFFREVAVEPGESLSFTEDLREYAELDAAGSYVVQARLYPELYRPVPQGIPREPSAAVQTISSNRLTLTLRPAPILEGTAPPVALEAETGAVLVRENMPPDKVVDYLLTARQKGQWEKFFLYLDLEAMISRDGARKRAWLAESEEGRKRMMERYRSDLRNSLIDGDISTIPVEFAIERTSYGSEQGTVVVVEKFRFGTYTERKRYTYYVKRRDDVWTVYDYSVVNLGTE
jgi:hypothetical protein